MADDTDLVDRVTDGEAPNGLTDENGDETTGETTDGENRDETTSGRTTDGETTGGLGDENGDETTGETTGTGAVTVRRARRRDEAAVRRLQSHLREPSPRLLSHAFRTGQAFVAVRENRPVGYVLPVAGDETHVAELVVAPAHRRSGHATRLLQRVLATARGRVTLFVHPDNDAARTLYASLGFRRVGRRPDFYAEADALVLAYTGDD